MPTQRFVTAGPRMRPGCEILFAILVVVVLFRISLLVLGKSWSSCTALVCWSPPLDERIDEAKLHVARQVSRSPSTDDVPKGSPATHS